MTKRRIYKILEKASAGDTVSKTFDIFIMSLIALNVVATIMVTVKALSLNHIRLFRNFEILSVSIFTIEYVLRLWSCTADQDFRHPVKGRLKFAATPMAIIDLLAILPFYVPRIIPLDLRFMRAVRLFRLFRLFKLGRYSEAMQTLGNVMRAKREELFITGFVVLILLILSSSIMYFVECEVQPKAFSSIPSAMWWGVATLTTVGYGDMYPVTPVGRFLGALIALLGIGMIALPTGILGGGFVEEIQRKRKKKQTICPHCGKDIHDL